MKNLFNISFNSIFKRKFKKLDTLSLWFSIEDGYILEHHRLVGTKKIPVIVQHGILADSSNWLLNGPDKDSLALALSEAGYDVWLTNSRGNIYGRRHTKLDVSEADFWDFSWWDMAKKDLPATINHILAITRSEKVHYIGHSQGSLIMLAALDTLGVEFSSKIASFHALAPISRLQHISTSLKFFAKSLVASKLVYQNLKFEFLSRYNANPRLDWLTEQIGEKIAGSLNSTILPPFVVTALGFNPKRYHRSRIACYLSHASSGTSFKDILHFGQMVRSGKIENYKNFETEKVEEITLVNINGVKIFMYSGDDDVFSDLEDVEDLKTTISEKNEIKHQIIEDFDHLSFLWGTTAYQDLYKNILNNIDESN